MSNLEVVVFFKIKVGILVRSFSLCSGIWEKKSNVTLLDDLGSVLLYDFQIMCVRVCVHSAWTCRDFFLFFGVCGNGDILLCM